MMRWIFCLLTTSLLAVKAPHIQVSPNEELPWFTGPLIALSSEVITRGDANYEPYFFATAYTGVFDGNWDSVKSPTLWNYTLSPLLIFGLNDFMDLYALGDLNYNVCQNQKCWAFGDITLGLDFQLYRDLYYKHDWYPNVKFSIQEVFPSGKYDHLDPNKLATDLGGAGTYSTQFQLILGKLIHFTGYYFMSHRIVFTGSIPSPVRVTGLSFYRGSAGTRATVYPAKSLTIDYAFELNLSRNWVFAIDVIGVWGTRTHYKGNPGLTSAATPAPIGRGASFQLSLAPALEYNWNSHLGIIFGAWLTPTGRNAPQFFSGVVAVNYYQ